MIPIIMSDSDSVALEHYKMIKYYLENTVKFYRDFFHIVNNPALFPVADYILYDGNPLKGNNLTGLLRSLIYLPSNNKTRNKALKAQYGKKAELSSLFSNLSAVLAPVLITNANDVEHFLIRIKNNLKEIIIDDPIKLEAFQINLHRQFPLFFDTPDVFNIAVCNILKKIFDYEKFGGDKGIPTNKVDREYWQRYDLVDLIGHKSRTCPYCNRIYTFIVRKKGGEAGIIPQLDHFLDKGTRPLFSLSFYNLIPSCSFCNGSSLKGRNKFTCKTHIHPYLGGFREVGKFRYKANDVDAEYGYSENLRIFCQVDNKSKLSTQVKGSVKVFELDKIYTEHADMVQDLIIKKLRSNDLYIDILKEETYAKLGLNKKDAYRIAFGNYYEEEDFHRRPLAKLTRDIAEQLKMI